MIYLLVKLENLKESYSINNFNKEIKIFKTVIYLRTRLGYGIKIGELLY